MQKEALERASFFFLKRARHLRAAAAR